MNRRAPKEGYDFGNKRQYRREVWSVFRLFAHTDRFRARVLLMPSAEGDEIEVALRNGFRLENMVIVDRNPAIVATLNRRYGNRMQAMGCDVVRAAERLVAAGQWVNIANLDLCGHTGSSADVARQFVDTGVFGECGMLAVTCLKGRETASTMDNLNQMTTATRVMNDEWPELITANPEWVARLKALPVKTNVRLHWIQYRLDDDGAPIEQRRYWTALSRCGEYRSTSRQTMVWGVWKIHKAPCICDLCTLNVAAATNRTVKQVMELYDEAFGSVYPLLERKRGCVGITIPSRAAALRTLGARVSEV
jgi:hypothetical protein